MRRALYRMSVQCYYRLGELGVLDKDVELLDGLIIEKMPKSPLHSSLCGRFSDLLRGCLASGTLLRVEQPLQTSTSAPEPDLAVVRGQLADFWHQHPATAELTIEIALSAAEIDRRKTSIYAAAEVKEYWIVEPEFSRITVFRRPAGDHYRETRVFEEAGVAASEAVPGFQVRLPDVWQIGPA